MMRKKLFLTLSALALIAALAPGCKKKKAEEPADPDEETDTTTAGGGTTGDTTNTGGGGPAVDPAGPKGSITGTVAFTGTKPALTDIKPDKDVTTCGTAIPNESVVVNPNNTLKFAVVRVVSDVKTPAPAVTATLDQHGCRYVPHVMTAVMGQKVEAKSSDQIMHNVHTYVGSGADQTGVDNISQPPGSGNQTLTAPDNATALLIKCDVHPWMTGYIVYSPNSWIAVTGDDGTFKIEGVPVGKHQLEVWHETFGKKTVDVEVAADKAAEAKFEFKGDEKPQG